METPGPGPEGDLTDLERRLGRWRPAAGALDRDRMLFDAGRAAAGAESRGRLALASAACLALLAVGLGGLLVRERTLRHDLERTLASRPPEAVPPRETIPLPDGPPRIVMPGPDSYLVLTRRVLAAGLDDPRPAAPDDAPGTTRGLSDPSPSPLRARMTGRPMDL